MRLTNLSLHCKIENSLQWNDEMLNTLKLTDEQNKLVASMKTEKLKSLKFA